MKIHKPCSPNWVSSFSRTTPACVWTTPEWTSISAKKNKQYWTNIYLSIFEPFLTLIGMSSENKKNCSSLATSRSKFYKTQWAWQGVKLTGLMSIFTSKRVWNFFIQIQLTKSNLKITREVKVPCLMPIRVNSQVI